MALLTDAQMPDADQLTVAIGISKILLMVNAKLPVAQAAMER
jgi:NAD(P)H-hydrate repair Nnr-like enzyme with NAD(P)H-hydrate epimerase domain